MSAEGRPSSKDDTQEESSAFILSSLSTHAPLLTTPVLLLSTLLSISPLYALIVILSAFFLLHLYTPLFLLPHLSAVLTLACPIYGTALTILGELGKTENGKSIRGDGAQWLVYWVLYVVLGWGRGLVGIWAPGWQGVFELGRDGALVIAGGGWCSREGLVSMPSRSGPGAHGVGTDGARARVKMGGEKSKALLEARNQPEAATQGRREKGQGRQEGRKEVKKDDSKGGTREKDKTKDKVKKDDKDTKDGREKRDEKDKKGEAKK